MPLAKSMVGLIHMKYVQASTVMSDKPKDIYIGLAVCVF